MWGWGGRGGGGIAGGGGVYIKSIRTIRRYCALSYPHDLHPSRRYRYVVMVVCVVYSL
jgi:hypothetical protein